MLWLKPALLTTALFCALFAAQPGRADDLSDAQARSRADYDAVVRDIRLSQERTAALAAEIATVRKDQTTLSAALVASAAKEQELSAGIDAILARLQPLEDAQEKARRSLMARRDVLAEVLGALQRMGLNPPPALLVSPEDALSSVRSAILLGAVVPGLRNETDRLVADLEAARRLARAVEAERDGLRQAVDAQGLERKRLAMLIGEKQRLTDTTQAALLAERWRGTELAAKAGSLKELIAGMDAQAAALATQREAAANKRERDIKLASLPVPDANKLVASGLFAAERGRLSAPVQGRLVSGFGEDDGNGGTRQGDTLATQSGAIVSSPADASVLYAGPFRSYGQLLILDAGDDYHVVLAGLSRIDVAAGQTVLAGEPVGGMGASPAAPSGATPVIGQGEGPELYVEFRKSGQPVDPAPWWAKNPGRKRNGT